MLLKLGINTDRVAHSRNLTPSAKNVESHFQRHTTEGKQ